MNIIKVDTCAPCGRPIEYVPAIWRVDHGTKRATPGEIAQFHCDREWFHIDGGRDCPPGPGRKWEAARPVSTCLKCKARGTLTTRQLPYGIETTCGADGCGYRDYFSIGD